MCNEWIHIHTSHIITLEGNNEYILIRHIISLEGNMWFGYRNVLEYLDVLFFKELLYNLFELSILKLYPKFTFVAHGVYSLVCYVVLTIWDIIKTNEIILIEQM